MPACCNLHHGIVLPGLIFNGGNGGNCPWSLPWCPFKSPNRYLQIPHRGALCQGKIALPLQVRSIRPVLQMRTCIASVVTSSVALPCPALPCPALPCPALPCPALPCPALPCPALMHHGIRHLTCEASFQNWTQCYTRRGANQSALERT